LSLSFGNSSVAGGVTGCADAGWSIIIVVLVAVLLNVQ
jgi:hypothetical protein